MSNHQQQDKPQDDLSAGLGSNPCITMTVGGHRFGIPIARVEDVFVASAVTPVPKASAEIVGLLNLRGKVVTAISLAVRLGLKAEPVSPGGSCRTQSVCSGTGASTRQPGAAATWSASRSSLAVCWRSSPMVDSRPRLSLVRVLTEPRRLSSTAPFRAVVPTTMPMASARNTAMIDTRW